jgi:hypothetical protein
MEVLADKVGITERYLYRLKTKTRNQVLIIYKLIHELSIQP